jgi:hypothetical protein
MKNKLWFYLFATSILSLISFNEVSAQGGVLFEGGLKITAKTEITPADSTNNIRDTVLYIGATKNIMHRIITDWKNKLYFGYDIVVTPQTEKNKFRLSFKPLSINPNKWGYDVENFTAQNLPKYPDDILVEGDDIITLELLENPQTKGKISDVLKIFTGSQSSEEVFSEKKPARDFTIDAVELQLNNIEVFINNEKIGKNSSGGVSGPNLYFYLPDKGRFIMSPFPRKGYNFQKIGVIENNKISFTFNGDNFKFVSSTPVLGRGGKWNLWVLHDPDYRSAFNLSPTSPYEYGAADGIEFLLKKRR